ncbi:MAG: hypothetical protein ACOX2F_01075 [bacterium]
MRHLFLSLFIMLYLIGCGGSKPANVELTINASFPEGVTCENYVASHFSLTLFNSQQKKTLSKEFPCSPELNSFVVYVEKDIYYFTLALKGKDNLNKSYGSGTADLSDGNTTITVEMEEYQGGLTFKWKGSDCKKFDVHNLRFTLKDDDEEIVSTVVWGKEEKIEDFEISCQAEMFEIVNIPATFYSASVNGFRTSKSTTPRITYAVVPEKFKLVSGQDQQIDIEHKETLVSDIEITWEFDSKSIEKCEDVSVTKIVASLVSDEDTFSEEKTCDNKFEQFYLYDISAGEYDFYLRGFDSLGETLFENPENTQEIVVEKGLIGKDAIKIEILLKEK